MYLYACTVCGEMTAIMSQSVDWHLSSTYAHKEKKSNDSPNFPHVVSGLTFYISKIYYMVWWLFEWKPFNTFSCIYFLVFLQIKFKLKMAIFL